MADRLMTDTRIEMGAIASAHGIKGQFKVKAFSDNPMDIAAYGPVFLADGQQLDIKAHSHAKGFALCSAKQVTSRNHAETLRGQLLYIGRDQLPDAPTDELYHADVIDKVLIARPDKKIGIITALHDFGAGTVIEVALRGKKTIMVPFGEAYQPELSDEHLILNVDQAWLEEDSKTKGE